MMGFIAINCPNCLTKDIIIVSDNARNNINNNGNSKALVQNMWHSVQCLNLKVGFLKVVFAMIMPDPHDTHCLFA